jgi:hypothetical protein
MPGGNTIRGGCFMSAKPSFSLGRALSAAVTSLPVAWGGAWLVLILVWAAVTFGPQLMFIHVAWGGGMAGGAVVHAPLLLIFALVILILALAARGAVYRAILFGKDASKEGLGFGGLQFGWPELRLLASDVIAALFTLVVLAAVLIVFAVSFASTGAGHGYPDTVAALCALFRRHQGGDWVFIVYLIGAALLMFFLGVRFTLRHAATIGERRIVAINALSLSSGNVGKLFVGLIVILIPVHLVLALLMHLVPHHGGVEFGHMHRQLFVHGWGMRGAVHALLIGVAGPVLAGFLASAYRQIVDFRAK